jgi:hypothetical protein
MRRIPRLLLAAGVAVALMPGMAQAASFPCTSFLHQLRVGKFGERRAERKAKHFAEMARKHAQGDDTKQFVSGDLSQEAFWRGDLNYLRALDRRIGQEDCDRFDYQGVVGWIRHRTGRLHADERKHSAKGTPEEDQKFEYASGGLRALGPNGVKIKRMAEERGINVDS